MNKMIIEDIEPENETHSITAPGPASIPHVPVVDGAAISKMEIIEESAPVTVKRRPGRPKIAPELRKTNNMRHRVVLYLSYPSADQIARLRNMAKAFNKTNQLRFARLIKIANSPTEAAKMVMALGEERREIERRYRVWLRRKIRNDKEIENKTFRKTVRALAKAIKNSRPIV